MASINATTSSGIVATADNTGQLQLQSAGTTVMTITSTGVTTQVGAPAFSAYGTAKQSLANNTLTKINFNTKAFDTATCYDTTNYRFTPNVAGYYQVNAEIGSTPNASGVIAIYLYKNGSLYSRGASTPNSSQGPDVTLSSLISLNGTTDYIEIYGYQNSGGALSVGSDASTYPFSAFLARSA